MNIRRRYTDECKAEAVRLVRDSARPVAQVARDLGIADHRLYRWRVEQRQADSQGHTPESMRTEHEELVRLRRGHRR
jgi:transposase